jgi:hypothetical protein
MISQFKNSAGLNKPHPHIVNSSTTTTTQLLPQKFTSSSSSSSFTKGGFMKFSRPTKN